MTPNLPRCSAKCPDPPAPACQRTWQRTPSPHALHHLPARARQHKRGQNSPTLITVPAPRCRQNSPTIAASSREQNHPVSFRHRGGRPVGSNPGLSLAGRHAAGRPAAPAACCSPPAPRACSTSSGKAGSSSERELQTRATPPPSDGTSGCPAWSNDAPMNPPPTRYGTSGLLSRRNELVLHSRTAQAHRQEGEHDMHNQGPRSAFAASRPRGLTGTYSALCERRPDGSDTA